MNLNRRRTLMLASGAIGLGAAVAFALPAGAAVVNQSPPAPVLKLGSTATLEANGAVVFAPVRITCQPGASAFLGVSVTEAVSGGLIASGTGVTQSIACTGSPQSFSQAVTPGQRAFTKGVAFAQASVNVCNSAGCANEVDDQRIIQIVK